jgi:hypothetical protein
MVVAGVFIDEFDKLKLLNVCAIVHESHVDILFFTKYLSLLALNKSALTVNMNLFMRPLINNVLFVEQHISYMEQVL